MENKFLIKAVHPGYTKDGKSNVGEMIEIFVPGASPDNLVSLAGLTVSYTKNGGDNFTLVRFPEQSYASGECILLKLAGTVDAELANLTYEKQTGLSGGLLYSGKVSLLTNEEVVDEVEWGDKNELAAFKTATAKMIVRDLTTMEFSEVPEDEYEVVYNPKSLILPKVDDTEEVVKSQCKSLEFSEVLSYYAESKDEQFIEFYNNGSEQVLLDGCLIRYKNKSYPLSGILKADEYKARYLTDFNITKNPTNGNTLEIIDTTGEVVDVLTYPNGQKKGASYAMIGFDENGEELWRTTYAVTPGEANAYQEYKTCEAGKVINETTGNCVKVTLVAEKTCAAGQFLNPLTGRCKKIETASATTECKEGYYLNEETGRCRKIVENNGTSYALEVENYEESSSFVALYAILGVVAVLVVYIIFEFRKEIWRRLRKVFR